MNNNLLIITLHADPSMPPGVGEWGGTHTYMSELLSELNGNNFNIMLVTRKVYESQNDIEYVNSCCRIVRLKIGEFGIFDKRELIHYYDSIKEQIMEEINKNKFTVDIIHSVYWNSGHVAMELSNILGVPYVHSVISNAKGRNLRGAKGTAKSREETESQVYGHAQFIICVSESEKNDISQLYKIDPDKILVAGQYVHHSFLYPAHDEYGRPRARQLLNSTTECTYCQPLILKNNTNSVQWWINKSFTYAGRISLDKGLDKIVQAWFLLFSKYQKICPPLWLIGGSPSEINQIRGELGIDIKSLTNAEQEGKIVWWGYLDEPGISAVYLRTLVLITHSLYEPGGRVAVEAMCEGLPVIATDNGFAGDCIVNWVNGFLIEYGDIEQLSYRMEHFIKQPYLSNILGTAAKEIGKDIIIKWSFRDKHIIAYKSALKKSLIPQTLKPPYFEFTMDRKMHTFPFNQNLIDSADVLQSFEAHGICDIQTINQIHNKNSTSMLWEISTEKAKFLAKILCDRINERAIWSDYGAEEYVIKASTRFHAEKAALQWQGIPAAIFTDDARNMIVRNKITSKYHKPHIELQMVISSLQQIYSNDISLHRPLFRNINSMLNVSDDFYKIDDLYRKEVSSNLPYQWYFRDYSLRVELLRWKSYLPLLPNSKYRDYVQHLFGISYNEVSTAASSEINLPLVLCHGGCDLKNLIFNETDAILLDNEKMHVGWPGIDFADLFITYSRKYMQIESRDWWDSLFNLLSGSCCTPSIAAQWVILGAYKEAISTAAYLKEVSPELEERINSMLKYI